MSNRNAKDITIEISKPRHYEPGEAYGCRILVYPLDGGAYSAFCVELPEVAGQAATAKEAVTQVIETFRETVLRYRARNQPIPWIPWDRVEVPDLPGATEVHPTVLVP